MDRQRIDKWLWHARVVRTRSAASQLANSGHVRINGVRVDAPSRPVRPGDVVTVALDSRVRVLKVLGQAERRGSADDARVLFEELTMGLAPSNPPAAIRDARTGRPTKRDRRALERMRGQEPIES